ncbi:MAG: hypothetical protein HZA20_10190 [Nitrospirae bacterium]|nr:hypothetical protein [Nitrospirota bacterium]
MMPGFNENISYKNVVFHIQTEDGGLKCPVITSLLYYKGAVLVSRKTDYSGLVDSPDIGRKVRELLGRQHKGMVNDLKAGIFDDKIRKNLEGAADNAMHLPRDRHSCGKVLRDSLNNAMPDIFDKDDKNKEK